VKYCTQHGLTTTPTTDIHIQRQRKKLTDKLRNHHKEVHGQFNNLTTDSR